MVKKACLICRFSKCALSGLAKPNRDSTADGDRGSASSPTKKHDLEHVKRVAIAKKDRRHLKLAPQITALFLSYDLLIAR